MQMVFASVLLPELGGPYSPSFISLFFLKSFPRNDLSLLCRFLRCFVTIDYLLRGELY